MKLISWNVNGIRAIYKKGFLDFVKEENPDILCIQETKAREEQIPDRIMDLEYNKYFSSAQKKGYSGVAVFTKEKPLKVEHGFGIKKFDSEGRILILYFKNFILFNIYFPNGKASPERLKYKLDFYQAFLDYAENVKKENKNIIFCGDVNTAHKEIDLARPKANEKNSGFLPIERKWLDLVVSKGYLDAFRIFNKEAKNYTWWDYKTRARDRNIGWRIDYFFISKEMKNKVTNCYHLNNVLGSDHCPICLELK